MFMLFLPALGCWSGVGAPATDKCVSLCETGHVDTDTETDTDTDTDADVDTDVDTDLETGVVQLYFVGSFQTDAAEGSYTFERANFGYGFFGPTIRDWVCEATGELLLQDEPVPEGCPDCEWAFNLSGATNSTVDGECEQFELADGDLDGAFDYSWGFASVYHYDYSGTDLPLANSLMLYYDRSWFAFAFNYDGRDWVFGDVEGFDFARPVFDPYGGYIYYYYY